MQDQSHPWITVTTIGSWEIVPIHCFVALRISSPSQNLETRDGPTKESSLKSARMSHPRTCHYLLHEKVERPWSLQNQQTSTSVVVLITPDPELEKSLCTQSLHPKLSPTLVFDPVQNHFHKMPNLQSQRKSTYPSIKTNTHRLAQTYH